MLDRAMPAEAVPGSTIPEDTEAEIQLRDGTWVWAQVIGQRKDRQGRWCVGLRWYASPSVGGREGWYLLDSRYIHRPNPALSHRTRATWITVRPGRMTRRSCGPGAGRRPSGQASRAVSCWCAVRARSRLTARAAATIAAPIAMSAICQPGMPPVTMVCTLSGCTGPAGPPGGGTG